MVVSTTSTGTERGIYSKEGHLEINSTKISTILFDDNTHTHTHTHQRAEYNPNDLEQSFHGLEEGLAAITGAINLVPFLPFQTIAAHQEVEYP